MKADILINGVTHQSVAATDRGLQYGDGIFETILVESGNTIFLHEHLSRLRKGCEILGFPKIDMLQLTDEINQLIENQMLGVVKVILTRGVGERGFLASPLLKVTRIVSFTQCQESVLKVNKPKVLRVCNMRLSRQPALAGIKHLNQLERVLARNEWCEKNIHEGLMLDTDGFVIEGTMSNLFIAKDDQLQTPALNFAGVEGVMRQFLFNQAKDQGYRVVIKELSLDDVLSADEVFITNSLMPVWFISEIKMKQKSLRKSSGYFSNWARDELNKEIRKQSVK
ncbi:MAG: hypothetical protein A6F71_02025 [Cycloclasticus sp. symbiont of Poecilosclerida sp. M]|nr:MAG: hypothetical protein A6F71_02025 [Cycloclasticus sp. symbiont of Poecilosclerida sp. M]